MKYLVDTPEIIWGCLDAREFLAAARRLLHASHVHAALLAGPQRPLVERRFPLVAHLWPNVEKFRHASGQPLAFKEHVSHWGSVFSSLIECQPLCMVHFLPGAPRCLARAACMIA